MKNTVLFRSGVSVRLLLGALAFTTVVALVGAGDAFAQQRLYTILYSFQCGADGGTPVGSLARDSAGNLYGTTAYGGASGNGTVFEIFASGQETVLYSFSGPPDGQWPVAGLVRDQAGNFYGTTESGGAYGYGTVFEVSPHGTETVLYSFGQTFMDGQSPEAGLILDAAGNLYGTTSAGGVSGAGTVFAVAPGGVETVLHTFITTDGSTPLAGLVRDLAGNLYGTTSIGGAFDGGTVFRVSPKGKEAVLYSFCSQTNCPDGAFPVSALLRDGAGNLYGTTENGGAPTSTSCGTVFKLDGTGTESLLFSFDCFDTGGYGPAAGLIEGAQGAFCGTASKGGTRENGVAFELSATGHETVLHRFSGSPKDGSDPVAGVIRDPSGNLYGTTRSGGIGAQGDGCGTVFKIGPDATGEQ